MELERTIQIAKREWENIRVSLEVRGDIGEFDSNIYINNRLTVVQVESENKSPTYKYLTESSLLVRNLIEMDNKLSKYGYSTLEAAYVFPTLTSRAAEGLGLVGRLAQIFGTGYGWVRTGWFNPNGMEKQSIIKHLFFYKIFFPLGRHSNWDFGSQVVKTKLDLVFHTFAEWQSNPDTYIQDVRDYGEQLQPFWRSLSPALETPVEDSREGYREFQRASWNFQNLFDSV
jgi:hypothetical protein